MLAVVAAALVAALVIAGFAAVFALHLRPSPVAGTPTAQPSATLQSTVTPQATGTTSPQPSGFVCANPQGSNGSSMTYAFTQSDGHVYAVTGCAAPRQLTTTSAVPIAWSPSNRYLAVTVENFSTPSPLEVIDTQTGAVISTRYATDFGSTLGVGSTSRMFFGWLDNNTFLGAISKLVKGPQNIVAPGPTTLVRVDLTTGQETVIGTIPGWVVFGLGTGPAVRVVANGRYLFYAAYSGSTATLHRFNLTTGTDSTLVSLGLYTYGGCQGSNVCGWTAPWDVSSNGSHILYHNPGASSAPSDTNDPKDTPLFYANPDGSGGALPFGNHLAASLVDPVFSPDGTLAVTTGSTYTGTDPLSGQRQMKLVPLAGAPATFVTGSLISWRGDSQALVTYGGQASPGLYDIATGTTTPLEAGSNFYLWGH
jgi:hypothetical protein